MCMFQIILWFRICFYEPNKHQLEKVERLIEIKLKSEVNLIEKMSDHHLRSGGKRLRALLTLGSAKLSGYELGERDIIGS